MSEKKADDLESLHTDPDINDIETGDQDKNLMNLNQTKTIESS